MELLSEITCLLGKVAITKQRIALTPKKPSKISKKMIPDYCIGKCIRTIYGFFFEIQSQKIQNVFSHSIPNIFGTFLSNF